MTFVVQLYWLSCQGGQEQKDTDRTRMMPAKEKIEGVGGTQRVSINMLIVV